MYEERFYRDYTLSQSRLEVSYKESDLLISTDTEVDKEFVQSILKKYYEEIERYIKKNPLFLTALCPIEDDKDAPPLVKEMISSSHLSGIGPFSSVAGAIAHYVGKEILQYASEVIVENGGDIFLKIDEDKRIGVYLGPRSKLKSLSLKIKKKSAPFGIASSSSFFGHSLNLGRADLVTVIAKDAIIADGFATALSNRIKRRQDVDEVLEYVKSSSLIEGLLVYFEEEVFLRGNLEIDT
ncbi:MAG: UPF0280 family protein [Candidatus Omnitrophota bacterium]|nr:MAG: UPF0280 family protein [Candidatus Omnitrophota bacterium]